jgi:hypothetical protein
MGMITRELVDQLLCYDPATGIFMWRVNHNRARAGMRAGFVCKRDGYVRIKINSRRYLAHRLAFLMVHGRWPVGDTDHVNQTKSDNRIANLREATRSQNKMNHPARSDSRTRCRGITPRPAHGNYQVRIQVDGKRKHIGVFANLAEAQRAYDEAAKRYHGEFNYRFAEAA